MQLLALHSACMQDERQRWGSDGGTNLKNVEGGWIQEVERDEVENPDNIMYARNAAQVPQGRSTVSVIDEID